MDTESDHSQARGLTALRPDKGVTTERRHLLLLTAVSAGLGAFDQTGGPERWVLRLGLPEGRTVEDWHLACNEHLKAIHTLPPARASADLNADLATLRRRLHSASNATDITELRRVMAVLSSLQANVLSRLGERDEALRWWHTARAAADATGDLHLQLGIRATSGGHALGHGQRDPATVLRLADEALESAGDAHSMGRAFLLCTRAKALATLGRHGDAQATLQECRDVMESEPPAASIMPTVWRMQGGQLEYSEVWVNAEAGDEEATAEACERVLSVVQDYQYRVMSNLQLALCTVRSGGVLEGVRHAATTIGDLPAQYRTNQVDQIGRRLLQAVPAGERHRPAVVELRDLLATGPRHVGV